MLICTYEDRPANLTGVKLLVLSLARHLPDARLEVTCPAAADPFTRWMSCQPNATLRKASFDTRGFNIKPTLLLDALSPGHDEVVFIDSDILVTNNFPALWNDLGDDTLVVSEEFAGGEHQGGLHRTLAWGLTPARSLPATCNSGFLRVTPAHIPLLHAWQRMIASPDFLAAQNKPWRERPLHFMSDQEALTALLAGREFAHLPIHYLRRGLDIIQHLGPAGYTPRERLRNVITHHQPALIHAQGEKPWKRVGRFDRVAMQSCPYTLAAGQYREQMGEDTAWLDRADLPAKVLRALALGNAHLAGLPLSIVDEAARKLRRMVRPTRVDRNRITELKFAGLPVTAGAAKDASAHRVMPEVYTLLGGIGRRLSQRHDFADARSWMLSLLEAVLGRVPLLERIPHRRAWRVRVRGVAQPLVVRQGTSDWSILREIFFYQAYGPIVDLGLTDIQRVVDLGANVGLSVRYWLEHFPQARVLAVEPEATNQQVARMNLRAIDVQPRRDARVTLVNRCIGAREREVVLDTRGAHCMVKMSDDRIDDRHEAGGQVVQVVTMSRLLERHGWTDGFDLLKCDIEGAEAELFSNCESWAWKARLMVLETHRPYTPDNLVAALNQRQPGLFVPWRIVPVDASNSLIFLARRDVARLLRLTDCRDVSTINAPHRMAA